MDTSNINPLHIIHFNDTYNISESNKEPVGGVARFLTALRSFDHLKPLILFSGDVFSPSSLSEIYKGEHMIKPLNSFGIHVACVGNHDFDFEEEQVTELFQKTNFPWLMTNLKMKDTGLPFPPCREYAIINHNGLKIGIIGLAEFDWIATLLSITEDDIDYEDFVESGNRWAHYLKNQEKCEFVIALTHMRDHHDKILAQNTQEIDIILGGHDHVYHHFKINDKFLIKSGTDFREFSLITIDFLSECKIKQILQNEQNSIENDLTSNGKHDNQVNGNGNHIEENGYEDDNENILRKYKKENICKNKFHVQIKKIEITKKYEEDPILQKHVKEYMDQYEIKMGLPIGYTAVDLETRFSKIRSQETNFSNFVADLCRLYLHSDIALINSGTIRSDCIISKGLLKWKDIKNMLPMPDQLVKLEITGQQILKALEAGVSRYPALEGRFPCLSGLTFTFNPKESYMKRVIKESVKIHGKSLELEKKYTMSCKAFIASGKDGYEVLSECKRLVDIDTAEYVEEILVKFFNVLPNMVSNPHHHHHGHNHMDNYHHHKDIKEIIIKDNKEYYEKISHDETIDLNTNSVKSDSNKDIDNINGLSTSSSSSDLNSHSEDHSRAHSKLNLLELVNNIICFDGKRYFEIAPKVEGRVTILNP